VVCFLCHSRDLKFLHIRVRSVFVCFQITFSCRIFRFSHLGVVSLDLVPVQDIFLLVLHRKLIRAPDSSKNSKYGVAVVLDWDSVHIQKFSAKTAFA
jgi:hypothetical protein